MQRLVKSRDKAFVRDEEAVDTDGRASMVVLPARFERETFRRNRRRSTNRDVDKVDGHTAPNEDNQPSLDHSLSRLTLASEATPRLLSDKENDRMNAKIDKLIAAISERRQIHFAPVAEAGEVDIFADRGIEHEVARDEYDIERDIANSPQNFGRIFRSGNGIRRIKSPSSLLDVGSRDSWTSTTGSKSSSNAWERAVAAADIRFAVENKDMEEEAVVRNLLISEEMATRIPFRRRLVHNIAPIPLDYDKPVRSSTPSVHSNGSEMDTSSPLFRKSCERVRRETYAVPPESTFERSYSEVSRLDDEWALVSEPLDDPPEEVTVLKALVGKRRAFGVFDDAKIGDSSSKAVKKPDIPSKALKDISNLRHPGYLQFNSFAKDARSVKNPRDTVVPITASSAGFEDAPDPDSRRAYIKKKWPGLLQDPSSDNTSEPSKLDGVARRRNEQAIGHPIDTSHYSLSHVRTSMADMSLNVGPARQAHFDLALARLEGHALPPSRSPIQRHPDSAALFDHDILVEEGHRPLSLQGPRPVNPVPNRALWRNFG